MERGDLRWHSPDRDIANVLPRLLNLAALRCAPMALDEADRALLARMQVTDEDLRQCFMSLTRYLVLLRSGNVPREEVLAAVGADANSEWKPPAPMDPLLTRSARAAELQPSMGWPYVGMVLMQEFLLWFVDSYRSTMFPGDVDAMEADMNAFCRLLSTPLKRRPWYLRWVDRLYWKLGHRYG